MKEKATVTGIEGKKVTLVCAGTESCESCAAHGFCRADKHSFEAWNGSAIELKEGDTVEVDLPTGKTIGSAFMVMIFPLLLFFLFFYLSDLVFNGLSEGFRVLSGTLGIAAGFGINFLGGKKLGSRAMPSVVRKI